MFKTAEIHIRRAYRGQLIIRNHQFGVQEAFLIEIDLDSRIEHICQIRAGTQMRQAVISTHGQHQTHIDT